MVKDIRRHSNFQSLATATILSGATASSRVAIHHWRHGSVLIPSTFNGATISFRASQGPGSFSSVGPGLTQDPGNDFAAVRSYPASTAIAALTITKPAWHPIRDEYMKMNAIQIIAVSAQAANRTLKFSFKG